jgi:uncharacterized protein (DUF2132 family)
MKTSTKILPKTQYSHEQSLMMYLRKAKKLNRQLQYELFESYLNYNLAQLHSLERRERRRDWMIFLFILLLFIFMVLWWLGAQHFSAILFD